MKKTAFISLLMCLISLMTPGYSQKPTYHWKNDPTSLALIKSNPGSQDFVLWQLNMDPKLKPFFHPVCSPDGTLLTAEAPADHPWHLGLWFCWKYINKLNYWEFTGDTKKAISEGRTDVKDTKIKLKKNGQATIDMQIQYHPWEKPGEPVMKEFRTIFVSAPAKDGSYFIEYDMRFSAIVDVVLDRTPVQKNADGVTWGGYAGLSMRFDQKLANPRYFSETRDSVINGEGNPYVAANLTTPGGKIVQTVIFDHPENPRYPSGWYTINRPANRFWFFSPALLYQSALELKAGEQMRLRYKILIPSKPLEKNQIINTKF